MDWGKRHLKSPRQWNINYDASLINAPFLCLFHCPLVLSLTPGTLWTIGTDFDTHPTFLSFQNPKSGFSLADRLRLKRPNSGAPVPLSLEVSGCEKFVMSHFAQ